jgi:hypothetical protein
MSLDVRFSAESTADPRGVFLQGTRHQFGKIGTIMRYCGS